MQIHQLEKDYIVEYDYVIGIDEAGRGPWAGPVTVGAVCVSKENLQKIAELENLKDSKKLSHKQRNILEESIKEVADAFTVADIDAETIDRVNILEATKLGILNCLEEIYNLTADKSASFGILIDGKFNNIKELILQLATFSTLNFDVQTVIDGDALCPSISAAAILAKEHRDNLMLELHKKYPEYGFDKHKGYGTKLHSERLKVFGPSDIHRKSFAPIKDLL